MHTALAEGLSCTEVLAIFFSSGDDSEFSDELVESPDDDSDGISGSEGVVGGSVP